eukprot:6422248-Prymnesium_polylepis.1
MPRVLPLAWAGPEAVLRQPAAHLGVCSWLLSRHVAKLHLDQNLFNTARDYLASARWDKLWVRTHGGNGKCIPKSESPGNTGPDRINYGLCYEGGNWVDEVEDGWPNGRPEGTARLVSYAFNVCGPEYWP